MYVTLGGGEGKFSIPCDNSSMYNSHLYIYGKKLELAK